MLFLPPCRLGSDPIAQACQVEGSYHGPCPSPL